MIDELAGGGGVCSRRIERGPRGRARYLNFYSIILDLVFIIRSMEPKRPATGGQSQGTFSITSITLFCDVLEGKRAFFHIIKVRRNWSSDLVEAEQIKTTTARSHIRWVPLYYTNTAEKFPFPLMTDG